MIISCFNFKGGVGKSTFAFFLLKDLHKKYNFSISTNEFHNYINEYENVNYNEVMTDNVIYDLGGNTLDVKEELESSDLIIIPLLDSVMDVNGTVHAVQEINKFKKGKENIIFVINRIEMDDIKEANEVEEVLTQYFPDHPVFRVRRSKAFKKAIKEECSILEYASTGGLKSSMANVLAEYKAIFNFVNGFTKGKTS